MKTRAPRRHHRDPDQVRAIANAAQLFTVPIGTTGGDALVFDLIAAAFNR